MRASHVGSFLIAALAGSAAQGIVFTTYTSKAAFLARVAADGVTPSAEGFEGLTATNAFDVTDVNAPRVSLQGAPNIGVWDTPYQGAHATEGTHYVAIGNSPGKIDIVFDVPRTHIGLTMTDYGDTGSGILRMDFAGGGVNIVDTHRNDGEEYFFGIVTDGTSLGRVRLQASNSGDSWGVDGIVMGTVPAPASAATGAAGLMVVVRRRRR